MVSAVLVVIVVVMYIDLSQRVAHTNRRLDKTIEIADKWFESMKAGK